MKQDQTRRELAISLITEYHEELHKGEPFSFPWDLKRLINRYVSEKDACVSEGNFIVDGVTYETVSEVARATNTEVTVCINRFTSTNFPTWFSNYFPKTNKVAKGPNVKHPVVISGVHYESLQQAALALNMKVCQVRYRCQTKKYTDWNYL